MSTNQQQQQPQAASGQPMAPGNMMPQAPGGQPMMGGNQGGQQRFPYNQNHAPPQQFMGNPSQMAGAQQMFMQPQQNMGGQGQFFNNQRGGAGGAGPQQYRQKQQIGTGFQQMPMMGGYNPNMFMGSMAGGMNVMNQGIGPMTMGGQIGQQAPQPKRDFSNIATLYAGNLSDKTFDLDLLKFFNTKGYKIASAKVMFDNETKRSKGFGYLNFYAQEEAIRCMEEMNNTVIDGRQVVLNKKKDSVFDSKANVLVRNLPKDTDQKGLMAMFSEFGNIKSCKLEVYGSGESRGFGYVQFESVEGANAAIAKNHGTTVGDKQIEVMIHSKKEEREDQGDKFTNLYVQNLPTENFTSADLNKIFIAYGEITSVSLNGNKPGSGFVSFKSHDQAKEALEKTNMKEKINDTVILVMPHIYKKDNDLFGKPKAGGSTPIVKNQKENFKSNIFVRFLPKDITEEKLREVFSEAGPIASIKLKANTKTIDGELIHTSQNGYVLFDDVNSAQKCIKQFDESRVFSNNGRPIKVDFWQSKDDLKYEQEEKNHATIQQLVNLVVNQSKGNANGQRMNQWNGQRGNYNAMMGDSQYKGNRTNNRGRGNYRGGGRGQGRGGYNKNQGQPGQNQHSQQQQQNMTQQQQYGNNKSMSNQQQQNMQGNQNPGGGPMGGDNQQQMMGQQQPAGPGKQMLMLPQIDLAQLEKLQGDDRRTFVGNNIYETIQGVFGDELAPIITGTLLDENVVDFKQLLSNNQYFTGRVNEAHQLLVQAKENPGQDQQTQQ